MTACTVYHLPRGVTCDGCKRLTKRLHLVQHPRRRGYCPSCCTACAHPGHNQPVRAPRGQDTIPHAAPHNTALFLPSSRPLKP
jgi:hypothetical protein